MYGAKKKGNHIDCPNRHWFAGESYKKRIYSDYPKVKFFCNTWNFLSSTDRAARGRDAARAAKQPRKKTLDLRPPSGAHGQLYFLHGNAAMSASDAK